MQNINVRIHVGSNMGTAAKDAQILSGALHRMGQNAANMQAAFNAGLIDLKQYKQFMSAMDTQRENIGKVMQATGRWTVSQRSLNSVTADFNERLARQKVTLAEMFGPRNRALVRAAYQEQLKLSRAWATAWSDDLGRTQATIFTPKTLDGIRDIRREIGMLGAGLHSGSLSLVNWGKNMQWTGRQLTVGFSVPISMAVTALGKLAYQADEALTRITKVYGDATDSMIVSGESLRAAAMDVTSSLTREYGLAAKDIQDIMGELAAIGLEDQDLWAMTREVSRASLLGDLNPDDSLTLLRTLRDAYRLTNDEVKSSVDLFNAIESSTSLTMQDIAEGLPRISGIMQAVGVSIKDTTVLLTAFKAAGIDVAEGANALKSIAFKAVAPTGTADKNFFAITGRSLKEIAEQSGGDFLAVMREIGQEVNKLDQQGRTDLVARVFGIHQGSRAITLLEQLGSASEQMTTALEIAGRDAGEWAAQANAEVENLQQSISHRLKAAWSAMQVSFQRVGMVVLEALLPIVTAIGNFVSTIEKMPESTKSMMMWAGVFLGVAGPLVMLLGLAMNFVGVFGRLLGGTIKLATGFKVLSAESHAASLAFKAASAMQNPFQQEMMESVDGLRKESAQLGVLNDNMQTVIRTMHEFVNAQRQAQGLDPIAFVDPAGAAAAGALDDSVAGAAKSTEDLGVKSARTRKMLLGLSAAAGAASLAASGLANVGLGDQFATWAVNISSVMMTLGLIGSTWPNLAGKLKGAGTTIGQALGLIASTGKHAETSKLQKFFIRLKESIVAVGSAMSQTSKLLISGFGLAAGAVVITMIAFWQKHKAEVEENRRRVEALGNAYMELGDVYGYTATSRLEYQRQQEDWDENSRQANAARIRQLKEEKAELVENIRLYAATHNDQQKAAYAMQQYTNLISQGVDNDTAMRAARDFWQIMTGQNLDLDQFKERIAEIFEVDPSVLNQQGRAIGKSLAEGVEAALKDWEFDNRDWKGIIFGEPRIGEDEKAALGAAIKNWFQSGLDISQGDREDAFEEAFRPHFNRWEEMFEKYQDWRPGATFGDMVKEINNYLKNSDVNSDQIEMFAQNVLGSTVEEADHLINIINEIKKASNDIQPYELADISELERAVMLTELYAEELLGVERIKEMSARRDAALAALPKGDDFATRMVREAVWQRYRSGLDQAVVSQDQLNVGMSIGTGAAEGLDTALQGIEDSAEDAADAVASLTDEQKTWMDANRGGMQYMAGRIYDHYARQVEAHYSGLLEDYDREQQRGIDAINAKYQAEEDRLRAENKAAEKAMDRRHQADKDALDAYGEQLSDQLDVRRKALEKVLDATRERIDKQKKAEQKAFKKQWEEEAERLKESQEARRQAIRDEYDARVQAIENAIKKEEEAEEVRQRIFEAEKERINRLSQLYNRNIDFNVAIRTGDLDEAARIANDVSTLRNEWASDDAAAASRQGSETRRDKMRSEIDRINEERDARIEALKDVEKAEEESLEARREAAEEALQARLDLLDLEVEAQKEAHDKIIEAAKKANDKIIEGRKRALDERHELEKERLAEELETNRNANNQRRDNEVQIQKDLNADLRREYAWGLEDEKQQILDRIKAFADRTPRNLQEQQKLDNLINDELTKNGVNVKRIHGQVWDNAWQRAGEVTEEKMAAISHDKMWAEFAKSSIATSTRNLFGGNITIPQLRDFFLKGIWPKFNKRDPFQRSPSGHNWVSHSGSIVGETPGFRTGKSGALKRDEFTALLQRGEGVVKKSAMDRPGVKEFIKDINAGRISGFTGDSEMGIAGLGMAGLMTGVMKNVARQVLDSTMMIGMEQGLAKHGDRTGIMPGVEGSNQTFNLDSEQMNNARLIKRIGKEMGMSQRDIIIGLMTAMQESSLRNLAGGDRDSIGLFQQRPSQGWGTPMQISSPTYATRKFFSTLAGVKNRGKMELWEAAQAVQRSAFPRAYAKHEPLARALMDAISGRGRGLQNKAERWKQIEEQMAFYREHSDLGLSGIGPITGRLSGSGMGWRKQWAAVSSRFPSAIRSSDHRPGAVTSSGWPSYHGEGRAIDIVSTPQGMMDIFNWIRQTYGVSRIHELYYSPANFRQVRQGQPYRPSGITRAQHWDHVHWAMQTGGWVPGVGIGDRTKALLEPKEFVVNKLSAKEWAPALQAINSGITVDQALSAGSAPIVAASVDRSPNIAYNVKVNIMPGNEGLKKGQVKSWVAEALDDVENRRGRKRNNR